MTHRRFIVAPLLLLALAAPVDARAETPEAAAPPQDAGFTLEQRRGFYEKTRRDTLPFALSNLAIPGLGNVLNDQPLLGSGFAGVWAIALFTLAYGLTNDNTELTIAGSAIMAGTYVGSIVTTSFAVNAYNAKLRRRYRVDAPARAPGLTVSFSF